MGIHDKNMEGSFVYASNNSPIEFNNWAAGEPNDYGNGEEDCVEAYENGLWNDVSCVKKKRSIVCARGNFMSLTTLKHCELSIRNASIKTCVWKKYILVNSYWQKH